MSWCCRREEYNRKTALARNYGDTLRSICSIFKLMSFASREESEYSPHAYCSKVKMNGIEERAL